MATKADQDAANRFVEKVKEFLPQMTEEGIDLFYDGVNNAVADHLEVRRGAKPAPAPKATKQAKR